MDSSHSRVPERQFRPDSPYVDVPADLLRLDAGGALLWATLRDVAGVPLRTDPERPVVASVGWLGAVGRCSVRTVRRRIDLLVRHGWLACERRGGAASTLTAVLRPDW